MSPQHTPVAVVAEPPPVVVALVLMAEEPVAVMDEPKSDVVELDLVVDKPVAMVDERPADVVGVDTMVDEPVAGADDATPGVGGGLSAGPRTESGQNPSPFYGHRALRHQGRVTLTRSLKGSFFGMQWSIPSFHHISLACG